MVSHKMSFRASKVTAVVRLGKKVSK